MSDCTWLDIRCWVKWACGARRGSDPTRQVWYSSFSLYLVWTCPVPQTPQHWQSPWGQRCSQSGRLSLRWKPSVSRSPKCWRWSMPSRSNTRWVARRQTEPSRRQSGSAWRSRNTTAVVPRVRLPRLPRHLGREGVRVGNFAGRQGGRWGFAQ